MDLDGDGHLDMLSGSWPGEIFFFKGAADRTFAAPVKLRDKNGLAINVGGGLQLGNDDMILVAGDAKIEDTDDGRTVIVYEGERIAVPEGKTAGTTGTASAVHAVDFTGDGVLDLLVGNIVGDVYLVANEGTAAKPVWAKERQLTAGSKPLHVDGDAGPFACDWDGDGAIDLLVGDGEGAVWFFCNEGSGKSPMLAQGVQLLPPGRLSFDREAPAEPPRGIRAKVCAVDWTGNGLPDLLVGDYASQKAHRPKPTPEEKAEHDKVRNEMQAARKRAVAISEKLRGRGERVTDHTERKKLEKDLQVVREQQIELHGKIPREYEDHGWVRLFKRKSRWILPLSADGH